MVLPKYATNTSSVELHRWYMGIVLDVLEGCQFNCSGCRVNKQGHPLPPLRALKEIQTLVEDCIDNGVQLREVQIGPTDIVTSHNVEDIRQSAPLRFLAQHAYGVVFNCPFLDPNPQTYQWLATFLEDFVPNGYVKFIVPLEMNQRRNIRYIQRIKANITYLRSLLTTVNVYKVYANYRFDYDSDTLAAIDPIQLADEMVDAYHTDIHEKTNVDFVTPHGRNGYHGKEGEQFMAINAVINNALRHIHHRHMDGPIMNDINPHEGLDWTMTYSNDKLYFAVFLNEHRFSFLPEYEVPKPWSYEKVRSTRDQWVTDGLLTVENKPYCAVCPNMAVCAERGVHRLMDTLGTTQCLSAVGPLVNPYLDNVNDGCI